MIKPSEIKQKAENKYCAYLQSIVEGVTFQPIVIVGNKKPDDDTVKFESELTELINHSKEKKGYGYFIEYQQIRTKKHGVQDIPVSISFQTETDYLKYLKKENETATFRERFSLIVSAFPELKEWIYKHPLKVIENDWDGLLKVCKYFKHTPKPHLYIRELPIQVHTKFIEQNKGIITELLNIIISDYQNITEKRFETRFNLKYDEPIVRFRIFNKEVSRQLFSGLDDLSVTISQFQLIYLPIQTVYIVENKMNMLTFPPIDNSIIIGGLGRGVEVLKAVEWLEKMRFFYWGDIDAQGFEILSQVRSFHPTVQSFLMDKETFGTFKSDVGKGVVSNTNIDMQLTTDENDLYKYLKENNLRLEQEKIPQEYALARIPR